MWRRLAAANQRQQLTAIVVDGLGHGPLAAIAAAEALAVFGDGQFDAPAGYFEAAHSALSTTRGAAIAFAQVDLCNTGFVMRV